MSRALAARSPADRQERPPQWPHDRLDVAGLRAAGWRPTPFHDFVLKVHQRCNLACDYCYVYTMADQSWRDRPTVMSRDVWRAAAHRIGEHVRTHGLEHIRVILHGGEPLLAGVDTLLAVAGVLRAAVAGDQRAGDQRAAVSPPRAIDVCLQTNGVLLDEPALDALSTYGIAIGISLDGTAADNDRHRRHPDGRSSYGAVHRALGLLAGDRYRDAFAGILCTVDPGTDAVQCYEGLLAHHPPAIDFLLPHANWSAPPLAQPGAGPTPYGDWLVAAFDRWYGAPRQEVRVRLFEAVIGLVLGGGSRSEQVGLSPVSVLVIETDGAIEQVDSLKSTYPGAGTTGLSVMTDPLDAALTHPGVVARQIGRAALCDTCLNCPIHRICGAGHYAHRYRAGAGFRNPSVYCADLQRLIRHAQRRIAADLDRQETRGRR